MNPDDKYHRCLNLLSEMHELIHIMLDTGIADDMNPHDIVAEAIEVLRQVDSVPVAKTKKADKEPNNKSKKLLH